ncbi:MAG: transporter substrate-binding domain-containing protein [Pseudomonadota bacterium]
MKFAYLIEPPFNYTDDQVKVLGCDVELARYVFNELGKEFEPLEAEFAELLPGVANRKWHMTTGLFATGERKKTAAFSRPIWALPDGILVKKGNPLGLGGYKSVAQNTDCVLAVIRDQFQHRSAVEFGVPKERIRIFETYTDAANAVQNEAVHGYASVARAHTGFLEQNPDYDCETVMVPANEKEPAFGCFAFNKEDETLRLSVNKILDAFIGSFQHREMMKKYGFEDQEIDLLVQGTELNNW